MAGSDHPEDDYADVDAAALLAGLSSTADEVSERALARSALPTVLEASGLSKRRAKEWSEDVSEAAPTTSHMTARLVDVWSGPIDLVQVTASVFASVPLAVEYLHAETDDASRARRREVWRTRMERAAAASPGTPDHEVDVTVEPIQALTATGERVCSETVVRVTSRDTGREQRQYERVAHLRVGRLVVEIVTRETDSVGVVMAGVLGRYETRLREQAATYR